MATSERRLALLQRHREMASHAFRQCIDQGWERPVIFILDLTDREGRKAAAAVEGKEHGLSEPEALRRIDAKAREIAAKADPGEQLIPASVVALPMKAACQIAEGMTDRGADHLRNMPAGRIPIVVVSDGGNSYAGIPIR